MSGFNNVYKAVNAEVEIAPFRKVLTSAYAANRPIDLTMVTGNPKAFYYATEPLKGAVMSASEQGGLDTGSLCANGEKKFLKTVTITPTVNAILSYFILADYLFYYPFIAQDTDEEQILDNSDSMTRYQDGKGVKVMLVTNNPTAAGTSFSMNYTNSNGVTGRITPSQTLVTTPITGQLASTVQCNSFVQLQAGDTGVRSIQSVTFNGVGTGLVTAVLVKPLATVTFDATVTEKDFLQNGMLMPIIENDAYLNFIALLSAANTSSVLQGTLTFIRG